MSIGTYKWQTRPGLAGAGAVDEQAVDADAQGEGAGVERGGADPKAVAGVARAAHVSESYVLEPSHRR